MPNRKPYNIEFCRFIVEGVEHCRNLKPNDRCKLGKCVYNHKWITSWERSNVWPGEMQT